MAFPPRLWVLIFSNFLMLAGSGFASEGNAWQLLADTLPSNVPLLRRTSAKEYSSINADLTLSDIYVPAFVRISMPLQPVSKIKEVVSSNRCTEVPSNILVLLIKFHHNTYPNILGERCFIQAFSIVRRYLVRAITHRPTPHGVKLAAANLHRC